MDIKALKGHHPATNHQQPSRKLNDSERQTITDNMLSEQLDFPKETIETMEHKKSVHKTRYHKHKKFVKAAAATTVLSVVMYVFTHAFTFERLIEHLFAGMTEGLALLFFELFDR